jgi:hypothetical protein
LKDKGRRFMISLFKVDSEHEMKIQKNYLKSQLFHLFAFYYFSSQNLQP